MFPAKFNFDESFARASALAAEITDDEREAAQIASKITYRDSLVVHLTHLTMGRLEYENTLVKIYDVDVFLSKYGLV